MKAYGVFEGGGARGYAHVGALRAAEARNIEFCGVAGTSIGAVIASLVAAGYRGAELFSIDENGEHGLLSDDLEATLLNSREYQRISRWKSKWRWITVSSGWFAKGPLLRSIVAAIAFRLRAVRHYVLGRLYLTFLLIPPALLLSPVVFILHGRLLRSVWSRLGATGTELFRTWLNEKLRKKLDLPEHEIVRFRHFARIPLRVVAADLSKGDIRVFGGAGCEDMEVAEAVAASISYPFFFRPVAIGDSIFVDGGLVSNFPAWVLDDLRAKQPRSYPTFGFRLLDPPASNETWPGDRPPILIKFASRLMAAILNSRQSLESRQIDDYHAITLRTHIRTLDFDLLKKERANLVRFGQEGVEIYFRNHIGPPRAPEEMEVALRGFIGLVEEIMTWPIGSVRAYLLQRVDPDACRVVYSALLERDADDALLIRWGSPSQALCLRLREPVLMRASEVSPEDRVRPSTKYLHAVRPADVSHVYCIPIYANPTEWSIADPMLRPEPATALCIDFAKVDDIHFDDRRLLDPLMEDVMVALAQAAGEFWRDTVATSVPKLDPIPAPSSDWSGVERAPGYYVSDRKVRGQLTDEYQEKLDNAVRRIQSRSRLIDQRPAA